MRRSIGWRLLIVVSGVVAAAFTVAADPASACDIGVPEETVTFVGTASHIDLDATTVTFQVTDVESTWTHESRPGEPSEPMAFPAEGDDVAVDYFSRDDVDLLAVGESYRLEAQTWGVAPVRWSSTALDFFAFSNSGCGAEVTPAATTRADGSSLEGPVQNFARRAGSGGYFWQTAVVIVAGVVVAASFVWRAKVRARRPAVEAAEADSMTVGADGAEP